MVLATGPLFLSDRICAEDLGAAVGPPWLGTVNSRHLTSNSSKVRLGAADCSCALANSVDIYVEVGGA